ncbi:methionine--tRNA ligase [Candidatus Peregrinibacteria bacterium]|nr:methionine--tRNA ligase [Candidatus Peregrinibacteria bacterium]
MNSAMTKTFYVTTAIPYVNAKPHIGFAMELIQADVLARYHRMRGDETFFLTGTDEHGSKIDQVAREKGMTNQELVDENAAAFKNLADKMNASNDYFVRTTDDDHKRAVQKLWKKLQSQDDIYKDTYEGLYCVGCEAYVLEKDLVDGMCPNHNKAPEKLKEENYFFRLSKYGERIKEAIEREELKIVPKSRKHEILAMIKEGLKDVSFSRPRNILNWGVDVPDDPDQVMYVWCDALPNYISGIGYETENETFKKFWPVNAHIIGKDILRFHAAIWIGMLMSAELPLPKAIYVHGFITSEGKKMSKSLNNVVDPLDYQSKYGADPLRYFLMKEIPTTDDGDFSKARFEAVYNGDLANNIGNLVSRVLAMSCKYFDNSVPDGDINYELLQQKAREVWTGYEKSIAAFDLKKALEVVESFATYANKYVEETQPWVLAKEDQIKLAEVLYNLLEMVRHLSLLLRPFTPTVSDQIDEFLGMSEIEHDYSEKKSWGLLKAGTAIKKATPLFARID